jgi:calmodulin
VSEHGLTATQIEAFREVFGLFDMNGGGTIDAQELHSALDSVDIRLTKEEIEDVLCVMDEDGNGEVDFEEFLTLMTSTEKYLEALGGE